MLGCKEGIVPALRDPTVIEKLIVLGVILYLVCIPPV
jgi:hypothetical protein